MIGHLYRYLDPTDSTKTLYVGQGKNRDRHHRSGRKEFGRRFKKRFPNLDLPEPIRWTVEITNQLELNEEETIAMFRFHSWRGYEGGMNITLPGSDDYKNLGRLGAVSPTSYFRNLSEQQHREQSMKGGRAAVQLGRGIHSPDHDRRPNARRNAANHIKNKTGLFKPGFLQNNPGPRATAETTEGRKRNGGLANVRSGHCKRIASSGGRGAVKSGHLARLRTKDHQRIAGLSGSHNRWHRDRNVINPSCGLCTAIKQHWVVQTPIPLE